MPLISRRIELRASTAETFRFLPDHENVTGWMFGVTSFTPIGDVSRGVGDRFAAEMKIGPKVLRSIVDVVEWNDGEQFALASVEGFDTRSRWSVRPTSDSTCIAEVEFGYSFPGGLTGRALAAMVEPVVGHAVSATDRNVRKHLEIP